MPTQDFLEQDDRQAHRAQPRVPRLLDAAHQGAASYCAHSQAQREEQQRTQTAIAAAMDTSQSFHRAS